MNAVRSLALGLLPALSILMGVSQATPVEGATAPRLFGYSRHMAMLCEVDALTGAELWSFMVPPGSHAGLAFNGSELFFTNENLAVIQVYLADGRLVRELPRPSPGASGGEGLGVSATSLFVLDGGLDTVYVISPLDGTLQTSFPVPGATTAMTFAGTRGTLFVRVGPATLAEVTPSGTVVRQLAVPTGLDGIAFSSSLGRLFGIADQGILYGLDPDTGAVLPGYPRQLTDAIGEPVIKTEALAGDEAWDPRCDDGDSCTVDCCADPAGSCVHTPIPGCGPETCNNCVDDDLDGGTDLEDTDCCPQPVPARSMQSRLSAGKTGMTSGQLQLRSALALPGFTMLGGIQAQIRSTNELLCTTLPRERWAARGSRLVFRDPGGSVAHGIRKGVIRTRPNGELRVQLAGARMDLSHYIQPEMTITVGSGSRCASSTVRLHRRKSTSATYRSR